MTGGIIVTKHTWNQIPEEIRPKLLEAAKRQEKRMMEDIRYMGDEAIEVMKTYGLEVLEITPEQYQIWQDWIQPTLPLLRGLLIDEEMFDWVMELREQMPPPIPPAEKTQQ
jgi:TRAP-type C4-dicarboxylate transport system substrate-binding protein